MMNPSSTGDGMYINLRRKMFQNLKASGVEGSIFEIAQTAYDQALKAENILLTPVEKKRLFSDVLKLLFEDMNSHLEGK